MIELNGKKFAENEKEFTNSLFVGGSTCVGYAKRLKRQIQLMDHQKNKIGVINRYGVLATATRQKDGKWRYSYGNPALIGNYSLKQQRKEIENLTINSEWKNGETSYCFKLEA